MKKLVILFILLFGLEYPAWGIQTIVQSTSQDLSAAGMSYTTTFPTNQTGYLATVSFNFSTALASAETLKVFISSRVGSNYNVELARYVTTAATTTSVVFMFKNAIPISNTDQIKVTTTNVTAAGIIYAAVVVASDPPGMGGAVEVYSNGALVVSGSQHRLLGIQHTDTTSAAVVRGDTISGQGASPLWKRLAVGSANKFMNTDGTDVTWSSWTLPAPTGDDYVAVADSTSATTWRLLPNCTDAGGNHLNYTQATNAFSCGTTDLNVGDITTVGSCTTGVCATNGNTDIFPLNYEGTADAFDTTFSVTDPTANRAIVFPNLGGTVALQTGAGFTQNSIPYIDSNGNLAQNNSALAWTNATKLVADAATEIASSGTGGLNVGIIDASSSVTAPAGSLITGVNAATVYYRGSSGAGAGQYSMYTCRGNLLGSCTASLTGDLWRLIYVSYTGAAYGNTAMIDFTNDGGAGAGSTPGRLQFYTTPASSTTLSEAMRIDKAQNVGIGTTSPDGQLDINGAFYSAEVAAPGTPVSTQGVWYAFTTDSRPYFKSDAGTAYALANTSIHSGGTTSSLSASATEYFPIHFIAAITTTNNLLTDEFVTPVVGLFRDLYCILGTAPANGAGTQSRALTLEKAGVATALTCTISEASTTCTDTTNTVTTAAGDVWDMKDVPSGTPATSTAICSVNFQT